MGTNKHPDFSHFSLLLIVFYLIPLLLFNTLLIVAIVREKAIDGTLRAVLVNIVTAGQVVMVGTIIAATVNVITLTELRPSDNACRLAAWLIVSGGAAKLMYMTTFASSAYVLIRYGTRKMKIWVAVVFFVGMWIGVLLSNAAIFSSDVLAISFHDYNTCAAHGTGYKAFIYAIGYISIYGLLSFTVSVLSAIATVWFIRHHTISSDITMVKAMLKFAAFLILGNVINFLGQAIPLLFAAFTPAGTKSRVLEPLHYVEIVFILLSVIPTPVLILIYFRPVRNRIKRILCRVCLNQLDVSEKSKTGKTAMSSTM